jgi:type IV fimbrial biogenesis protein FimT
MGQLIMFAKSPMKTGALLRKKRNGGFTLAEVMIVTAILGVVLAIAAPSLSGFASAQRVKSGVSDLQASMFYARSEALKRASNVDVKPVSGNWTNGWQVSVGATVLRTESVLANKLQIDIDPAAVTPNAVTYRSDGRLVPGGPGFIRVSLAGSTNVPARCVTFTLSGLPRSVIDTDTNAANGC